jgi:hypothetical protein
LKTKKSNGSKMYITSLPQVIKKSLKIENGFYHDIQEISDVRNECEYREWDCKSNTLICSDVSRKRKCEKDNNNNHEDDHHDDHHNNDYNDDDHHDDQNNNNHHDYDYKHPCKHHNTNTCDCANKVIHYKFRK